MADRPSADSVLHVVFASDRGGAEVIAETLATEAMLRAGRYRPIIAVPAGSSLIERWRLAGLPVTELPPIPRFRHLRAVRAFQKAVSTTIATTAPAIVHTHGVGAQIAAGRAARILNRPVVWHLHDRRERRWTGDGLLHRWVASTRVDLAIAVSGYVAEAWKGALPESRLIVVPNGVSPVAVAPARSGQRPTLVWAGRLQRWKGAHTFLEVVARVRTQVPDLVAVIVGGTLFGLEPAYPDALRRQADLLGLSDIIEWVGQVDDARPWLAAADVVVHCATEPEPFGLVIVEAMMQGVPVVAFREGGPDEILAHGETGALVDRGDVDTMAREVAALLSDRSKRVQWGRAARHRAQDRYSAAQMLVRVESAYDRVRSSV